MPSFSPPVLLDPTARLEYTRHLLSTTATRKPSSPHPLALLLFLLDATTFVTAADRARGDGKRPISGVGDGDRATRLGGPVQTIEPVHSTRGSPGSPLDANVGASSGREGQRLSDRARQAAPWNAWVDYLKELYLHPCDAHESTDAASASSSASTSPSSSWHSPLRLPPDITTYLTHLPYSPVFDDSTRTLLLAACRSAITHLSPPAAHSPSASPNFHTTTSQTTLDMLMSEVGSKSFPGPLVSSTVSNITRILTARRQQQPAAKPSGEEGKKEKENGPPAEDVRQIVTSLLSHYVSPTFSVQADPVSHEITYSTSPSDDRLVRSAFPSTSPSSSSDNTDPRSSVSSIGSGSASSSIEESDIDDVDTRSIRTGIRDAHLSIQRKENKLRQLLGDNWQQGSPRVVADEGSGKRGWSSRGGGSGTGGSSGGTGTTSGGTVRHQSSMSTLREQAQGRKRATSIGSDVSYSQRSSDEPELEHERVHHQRLVSTSSSQTPLIDSSAHTPASPSRKDGHRRIVSQPTHTTSSPYALSTVRPGHPPLSPAVPSPALTPSHSSGFAAKPFGDLASIPSSPPPFSRNSSSRLGPPSPRRTSLDSSLDYVDNVPRSTYPSPPHQTASFPTYSPEASGSLSSRLPMNRNVLSAQEKRELVRRSKKLEKVFGATFQEAAAQRVLVDQQSRQPPVLGRSISDDASLQQPPQSNEPVSPTNTSFPRPKSADAASPPSPTSPHLYPRASIASSTTSSSNFGSPRQSRRRSLAPPGPTPGYSFGAASMSRRQSVLSHTSSVSSLHTPHSPSRSPVPSLTPSFASHTGSVRMHRSSSSPSRRSSSFSSLALPPHEHSYFSSEPRRLSTFEREERETRRRKLEKVRRVLGERVPVGLVVKGQEAEETGGGGGGVAMGRSKSAGGAFGGILGGKKNEERREASPVRTGGDAGWGYVEPEPEARVSSSGPGGEVGERASKHKVVALQKARKLENLFGDLPPQSLYLTPSIGPSFASTSSTSSSAASSRPLLSAPPPLSTTHRRSVSDLSSFRFSPSPSSASSRATPTPTAAPTTTDVFSSSSTPSSALPLSVSLRRFTTHSTINSYRQSIASLGYIAERDPAALDEIGRVYRTEREGSGESGMTGSSEMSEGERDRAQRYRAASLEGEGERDGEAEGEGGTPLLPSAATNAEYDDVEEQEVPPSPAFTEGDEAEPWERSAGRQAPGMSRSASNTSHRAVKSAQKVAQVLGTTRGEVWRMLLDDIAASIEEDLTLDEDEREEVILGVERLRQKGRD